MSTTVNFGEANTQSASQVAALGLLSRRAAWRHRFGLALAALGAAFGVPVQRAEAEDLRVLSAAAVQTVLKDIGPEFERRTGHRLVVDFATMGAINQRVLDGETADLIIGSTQSIAGLVKAGRIDAASQMTIAKVGIGIVVSAGRATPSIVSEEDLKCELLAAKYVVYAAPSGGGAAGIHIAGVLERFGLAEPLRSKIKLGAGGDVTEVTLALGPGAIGMTQVSEIVGKSGARFVGPMPESLQNYTGVKFGTPAGRSPSKPVEEVVAFLRGSDAAAALRAKGFIVD